MAKVKIRIVHHPGQLQAIISSPGGGVYKDMFRRATNVQTRAKRNLEMPPRRVDTGMLRSDIHVQMLQVSKSFVARVGFNLRYGLFVHEGTGIYGPTGSPIVPKSAKMLRWKTRQGIVHYAASVKGMRPNAFLKKAVGAAKD